jgi:hypothetical protein
VTDMQTGRYVPRLCTIGVGFYIAILFRLLFPCYFLIVSKNLSSIDALLNVKVVLCEKVLYGNSPIVYSLNQLERR